ncbi:hypothetical protein [Algoriphagus boritolerans]|uniref:hypothetical protein n=1 Tax=Algoriphagus boritolerans TaxID=308111 RepID=UPI000AA2DA80
MATSEGVKLYLKDSNEIGDFFKDWGTEIKIPTATSILVSSDNNLWIGTKNEGFYG